MKKILQVRFVNFGEKAVTEFFFIDSRFKGDCPLPTINKLYVSAHSFETSRHEMNRWLTALQHANIFSKEAEIYEPKTIKADWKQIYPREFAANDIYRFPAEQDSRETSMIISIINQIQLTEAGGLEVHELIVYEV